MAIFRFVGDVHGKFNRYKTILANSPHRTIQVGDMGVGFKNMHGENSANPPFDMMVAGGHRFIRGNHDNPAACRAHRQCIRDGTVEDNMMFIGGAVSIDRAYRIEGSSWWPDEELSNDELTRLSAIFDVANPEVMVTHDCPEAIAVMIVGRMPDLRGGQMKMDPRFASRTRQAFEAMRHFRHPRLWLFGHWHVPFDEMVDGTRFICLPELEFVDVDMDLGIVKRVV